MTEQQKILIVDDDKINRMVLANLLKDDYRIFLAKSGAMALDLVEKHAPDIILLDVIMPEMDGYQVLSTLKSADSTRNIPVILITGLIQIEGEEKGLALGAADYITKPFNAAIVRLRVRNHAEAVRQWHLLEKLALLDPLTGIPNRRRLEQALQEKWRQSGELSAIMIDVDFFKSYNDHYGHVAGDVALRRIASVLQGQMRREGDLVARYGGEEFVVLLPRTDDGAGQFVAEKIRQNVVALGIPHDHSAAGSVVSVSIGGATVAIRPADGLSEDILDLADKQLYCAKEQGRNRVVWGCTMVTPNSWSVSRR